MPKLPSTKENTVVTSSWLTASSSSFSYVSGSNWCMMNWGLKPFGVLNRLENSSWKSFKVLCLLSESSVKQHTLTNSVLVRIYYSIALILKAFSCLGSANLHPSSNYFFFSACHSLETSFLASPDNILS